MTPTLTISEARRRIADIFSAAVHGHRPTAIVRGRGERAFLLGERDLARLVARHEFHPQVLFEPSSVSIWLPEFALYGRGASLDEAQADLLAEVRAYVDEYVENAALYVRAPNRASHFAHVVRALLDDAEGNLLETLFAPPAGDAGGVSTERVATA